MFFYVFLEHGKPTNFGNLPRWPQQIHWPGSAGGQGRVWAPHFPANPDIYQLTHYPGLSSTIVAAYSDMDGRRRPLFICRTVEVQSTKSTIDNFSH